MIQNKQITDKEAKAIKVGEAYSEKVGSKGEGAMQLLGRKTAITIYYRYTDALGKRYRLPIGSLSRNFGLKRARARCRELSKIQAEHPDLRQWLEREEAVAQAEIASEKVRQAKEAGRATLKELLSDYVGSLKLKEKASARDVEKSFNKIVFVDGKQIAEIKAKNITPDHIVDLLRPMSNRGAKVYRNRMRSYLHAAFQYGLKAEYDETRVSAKSFGLTYNPVAAVPALEGVERVGERALSDAELKQFYSQIQCAENVGPLLANFFRFLIAIAGQRPTQVLAATWDDYDLHARTVRIVDRKGRGSKPRVHLVPLTTRAITILNDVKPLTGTFRWPFSAYGRSPLSVMSLKNGIKRFRESQHGVINGEVIGHFSSRDIRRSCKQLMTRAEIRRDLRNLLQNHGQTGVDVSAYANDPTAHLPEKRRAMISYEAALKKVLAGDNVGERVVKGKFGQR